MMAGPNINCELTFKSLVYFIRKEAQRAGFQKAVLGLSGGIDSAVVVYLAAHALGPENVTGLLLPYRTSSKSSVKDAMLIVKQLGINHHILKITGAVEAMAKNNMVEPEKLTKNRLGNIMARVRMITIFDYSLAHGAIVLGTSNKSEIALGYATLFGDIASAVNPIGDIFKSDIFRLAQYLGIPEQIISKPPSADLWEGQTDEGEIGFSYAEIDSVLYRLLDKRITPERIIEAGFDKKLVDFVAHKVLAMHYKRKIPVIAKLSHRTFGVDFLYAKDINS